MWRESLLLLVVVTFTGCTSVQDTRDVLSEGMLETQAIACSWTPHYPHRSSTNPAEIAGKGSGQCWLTSGSGLAWVSAKVLIQRRTGSGVYSTVTSQPIPVTKDVMGGTVTYWYQSELRAFTGCVTGTYRTAIWTDSSGIPVGSTTIYGSDVAIECG